MVIFHSCVSLPEGNQTKEYTTWPINSGSPSHCLQVSEGDDLGSVGGTLEWQGWVPKTIWLCVFPTWMIIGWLMGLFRVYIGIYKDYGMINGMIFMWVKQCHKPPMTVNGNHTTYKNGDVGGGLWNCFTHITPQNSNFQNLTMVCDQKHRIWGTISADKPGCFCRKISDLRISIVGWNRKKKYDGLFQANLCHISKHMNFVTKRSRFLRFLNKAGWTRESFWPRKLVFRIIPAIGYW